MDCSTFDDLAKVIRLMGAIRVDGLPKCYEIKNGCMEIDLYLKRIKMTWYIKSNHQIGNQGLIEN